MANESILIQVSAFSGLIGALLTQGLTGIFSYLADKRKSNSELKKTYRDKKIDIAENFYFVNGEKMAIVKKNIEYWKNYHNARSEKSLDFLNQELKNMKAYMDELDKDNWKYNLVSLYFDVSLSTQEIIASNLKSKELYLTVLDLTDAIRHALAESKSDLYELYEKAIKELCDHYEAIVKKMADDMHIVKSSLLQQLS
ncbi:hypothetical protein FPZ42_07195 [Mucilaginibacter achroorhodeus]|uniref:Uncharacterized protein n=1 Tax=Mucilaginibacter achroorhodeus TaxID=2599294 RepID=A0A563U631_9SPHI|nr:hypothetical protein [Mucilaginibacter achroorhodeus]TWR26816.1 hypothetical protein FPZ42_07195 [Mucilaginibacter achroorhodeus]